MILPSRRASAGESAAQRAQPADGFVASANNKPYDAEPGVPVGWFFSSDERIRRLRQLLSADDTVTLDELKAMQRDTEASGWLTADQAARVQPGMEVELGTAKGSVLRVEKAPYVTLGDFEVTVQTTAPIEAGSAITATFRFPAGDAVTAIPQAALLTTAEGTFVYAKNDEFYLRCRNFVSEHKSRDRKSVV